MKPSPLQFTKEGNIFLGDKDVTRECLSLVVLHLVHGMGEIPVGQGVDRDFEAGNQEWRFGVVRRK